MAETVEVEITIDESADVSERNIMVLTPQGLSNPVKFMVGALPEVAEDSLREVARERASFKKTRVDGCTFIRRFCLMYCRPKKLKRMLICRLSRTGKLRKQIRTHILLTLKKVKK